jgi:hypothetical protein
MAGRRAANGSTTLPPAGHWRTLTLLAALSLHGLRAAMTVASPTDGDVFLAYLEQVLGPRLEPGDVVVMDNLAAHKVAGVRSLIEARAGTITLSAALLARLQPHRAGLVEDQRVAAGGQSPHPPAAGRCGHSRLRRHHPGKRCRLVRTLRISDISTMKLL